MGRGGGMSEVRRAEKTAAKEKSAPSAPCDTLIRGMSLGGQTEQLRVRVQVGGEGRANVDTGLPVLDRLLVLLSQYSGFDVVVALAPGDSARDAPRAAHALGEALSGELRAAEAQGYGSAVLPRGHAPPPPLL